MSPECDADVCRTLSGTFPELFACFLRAVAFGSSQTRGVPCSLLFSCFSGEQEQSFATNHMETGVHIGKGTIQHLPEDYVVPLFKEGDATFWRRESLLLPKVNEVKFLTSKQSAHRS